MKKIIKSRFGRNLILQVYISTKSIKITSLKKGLAVFNLPKFARKNGFDGLEISDREINHYDKKSLQLLSRKCSQNNCGLILDVNADLTFSNETLYMQEIKHVRQMIDIANKLEIGLLRICLGGQFISIQQYRRKRQKLAPKNKPLTAATGIINKKSSKSLAICFMTRLAHYIRRNSPSKIINIEKKKARVIDSLREIVKEIDRYKIKLGIENHWGVSSRIEDIMEIIGEINSPYLGTCPDFSNFPKDVDPLKGLEMMASKAMIVHAKCYGFNKNWEDKHVDFKRCLKIFKKTEYNGPITVEYEGESDDLKNCRIARQLILNIFRGIG